MEEKDFDKTVHIDSIEDLPKVLSNEAIFEEVASEHKARLAKDPEWANPRGTSITELIRGFVNGILTADPYYTGYKLPPNFESVVNFMSFELHKKFNNEWWCGDLSLIDIEKIYWDIANEHPDFRAWEEVPDGQPDLAIVTRYSPVHKERDWISLEVIVRNACVFIRDKRRQNDAFDKAFEEKYGKLSNEEK